MNDYPDNSFWTTKHFVTKLDMMMRHYEPECPMKKLVYYLQLQGQGDSNCWYNQVLTVSTISFELLILLQPHLVLWEFIISQRVLWIFFFYCCVQCWGHSKTSKCQWMSSRQDLLNCWTVNYQTWYGDASSWARVSCKNVSLLCPDVIGCSWLGSKYQLINKRMNCQGHG